VGQHDGQIAEIIEAIRQLLTAPTELPKRGIGFHVREKGAAYRAKRR
jgi:hypothetical protein